jgi:hypothetical protein
MSDIDAELWDVGTVTTADFAIQINLTQKLWTLFKEYKDIIYLRKKVNLNFKDFLIEQIES